MATFLGSYDEEAVTCTQSTADAPLRLLMPPEWFENNPGAKAISSPPRTIQYHGDREPTEVWGMGTLVFELSTGIPAGNEKVGFPRDLRSSSCRSWLGKTFLVRSPNGVADILTPLT